LYGLVGVRIRTVLDARPSAKNAKKRFCRLTLLLAHSWAALSDKPPLDVIVVGDPPPDVYARLRELGAEVIAAPPHPLTSVSKFANKLVALKEPSDVPVLLVDNDVCFLDEVASVEGREVRASVEKAPKVRDAQWAHIAAVLNLRPLAVEWVPPRAQLKARLDGSDPRTNHDLYLNGGVLWVRRPADFEPVWARHLVSISTAFDDHPLSSGHLRKNDQPALATAVAECGGFDLLPLAYNYRPICFQLGLSDQPKILHLTQLGRHDELPLSQTVAAYWERLVINPIRRGNSDVEVADQLVDEALAVRDRVLTIIADAGLDSFAPS
jgi:hypothetical protein